MTAAYAELARRFRAEIEELDRIVKRVMRVWDQANTATVDRDIFIDSVALNLHSFYSGLERLFLLVATHMDGQAPASKNWHQELLQTMGQEVSDVRPALFHPGKIDTLDEFRRFRHLVRNVYATNLLPERMDGLRQHLPPLWRDLRKELLAFADFLQQLTNG